MSPTPVNITNLTHDSLLEFGAVRALGSSSSSSSMDSTGAGTSAFPPKHIVAFEDSFVGTVRGLDVSQANARGHSSLGLGVREGQGLFGTPSCHSFVERHGDCNTGNF